MPFPSLDPVIFEIGPFALRWYALAYIAGLMLGWRYVIMLSQSVRLWPNGLPASRHRGNDELAPEPPQPPLGTNQHSAH